MQRKYAREVRAAVLAVVPIVLAAPAASAGAPAGKVAFLDRGALNVVDLATGSSRVVATHVSGPPGLSGDGKLVSVGGRIVGGPTLTTGRLAWAPTGGTAAHQTPARPVLTWSPAARALWWSDLEGSASIAADGLPLYANRAHLADTLAYPDYVSVCGGHLAVAQGGDRYAMHGKRIVFDGRDVSRDPSRSWVSPSCSADGTTLVAAASVNTTPPRIGREHRAIWQLLPRRKRLTSPPAGFTDELPRLLRDGSVLFVRTRSHSTRL